MTPPAPDRAAAAVVAALEARIHSGALPDGTPLPSERSLMDEFNVSRTVVREATQALSARGLVEARPRHRPVVRRPGYQTALDALGSIVTHLLARDGGVKNLFETRCMIEGTLVRNAAKNATKADLAQLRLALDTNEQAIADSDLFYKTDVAFHGVLYEISGNPVMPALHHAYTSWLSPHWTQMPRLPDRNARNHADHAAILDAILMRDPDAAEDRLHAHLAHAWKQVSETFQGL